MQPQLLFDRTIKTQQEIKELKNMIKDALVNSQSYQKIDSEIKELKEKQKKIKDAILEDFSSEGNKLDVLKTDIDNDKMLLSDASLTKLMKGESVEVQDSKGNKYVPNIKITFKKIK